MPLNSCRIPFLYRQHFTNEAQLTYASSSGAFSPSGLPFSTVSTGSALGVRSIPTKTKIYERQNDLEAYMRL